MFLKKIKVEMAPILIWIFVIAVTANIAHLIYWILALEQPVPIADHMDILINILRWIGDAQPQTSFGGILFHNEHMILTTYFFTALDLLLFGATSKFLFLLSFISQFLTACVVLYALKKSKIEGRKFILTSACVVAMLLSGSQLDNFLWGSQVQFIQVYMFACLAFVTFVQGMFENRLGMILIGFISAILSTFSMANGGLVLIFFLIFSLWMCFKNEIARYRRWSFISSLVLVSIWLLIYASFYKSHQDGPSFQLSDIYRKVIFLLNYIGSPITFYSRLIGGAFGLIGILLGIWLNIVVLSRLRLRMPFEIALILVLNFILLSALVTSLGRTDIAPRYNTPALLYWSIILILCVINYGSQHIWRKALLKAGIIFCLLVMFTSALIQDREIFRWRGMTDNFNTANAAMISGVEDVDIFRWIYPWDNRVQQFTNLAKNLNLSLYSPSNKKNRDISISNVTIKNLPPCFGEMTDITELPLLVSHERSSTLRGVKINGNLNNVSDLNLKDLIVTNPNFDVVGFGHVRQSKSSLMQWSAFAKISIDTPFVNIFSYSQASKSIICKVGVIGVDPKISFSDLEAPIENLSNKTTGNAWFINSVNSAVKKIPFNGVSWGSGGLNGVDDSAKGTLTIGPIIIPPNSHFIVIPAVVGPSKEGLDLRLLSAKDRAIQNVFSIAKMKTHVWEPLVFDISGFSSGQQFVIEASDNGSGWGQWLGIGPIYIMPFKESNQLKD
jgi:hypothetical protein